jgi:2-polyprenyl-6-methoxyphenol hydroxylase-like FAD-dependent oxidoreductase
MAPLRILVCGGGCAGPALAFWLSKTGHDVVVVERHPILRTSGAQIDLRGQGIEMIKRMGLLEAMQDILVDEPGCSFVDTKGRVLGTIMANTSGRGPQSFTSEFEFMRGDFVRLLYKITKDKVKYIFGLTVERFEQDDDQVVVHFSDGSSDRFDLLVGADGQGSRIRKAILPPNEDPYYHLGVHGAWWFVPRSEMDSNISESHIGPEGRMIMRRSHSPNETQVYFMLWDQSPSLQRLYKLGVDSQKAFWSERFTNGGWRSDQFLKGMWTTDNFYSSEVLQVRISQYYKGRVVLLGDAAYCPSPLSGMGTSSSLVGAYILAGEINRNPGDFAKAFRDYDTTIRPFMNETQKINIGLIRWIIPQSRWGVSILHFIVWLICLLRLPSLIRKFSKEEVGGWKVPEYPELDLEKEKNHGH